MCSSDLEIKNKFEAQGKRLSRQQITDRSDAAVNEAEAEHAQLAAAVAAASVPVTYTLKIEAQ